MDTTPLRARRTADARSLLPVALLALLLSVALPSPAHATAATSPESRDTLVVGRFQDHSEWGDFSSPLTQALAVLALHRAPDTAPPDASVALLLAQQCADGSFPDAFLAPSVEGAPACTGAVDTTALVVQALDAVGATTPRDAAVAWLEDVQAPDGSLGAADGTNASSTGLAALALHLGGADAAAEAARQWVLDLQDGCDTDTPGRIPFAPDTVGFAAQATAQALLGLTRVSLADAQAGGDADLPAAPCATPDDDLDDPVAAAVVWLAGEPADDGLLEHGGFPQAGPTIDLLLALAAAGDATDLVEELADRLTAEVGGYTRGEPWEADAAYAGATAKLALGLLAANRDPRDVGGIDLVEQLLARETTQAPTIEVACDDDAVAGTDLACHLSGLLGGETVRVVAQVNPVLLDELVTADGDGTATVEIPLPADLPEDAVVTVTVDALGAPAAADVEVEVLAAGDTTDDVTGTDDEDDATTEEVADTDDDAEELPETGAGALPLALAGGVALLAGSLLLRRTRVAVDRR